MGSAMSRATDEPLPGGIPPAEVDTVTIQAVPLASQVPRKNIIGRVLLDRYLIEEELGRGGGGTVYRALDQRTRARVAIKVLNPQKSSQPRSSDELYRELRFGRSINHPNVCRVFEVFESEGSYLLVMEYASRGTLRTTLHNGGATRPVEEKLTDARAVIDGMSAIHRAGLVHRDLKPDNILRASDGRLLVSDFGLARALDQTTITTGLAGTPAYLAPEALTGMRGSQTSDVWSLGMVLHEILVGRRPGEGPNASPPRRNIASSSTEAALARVCEACLEVNPKRRPKSAVHVASLLENLLRSRSITPRTGLVLSSLSALLLIGVMIINKSGLVRTPMLWAGHQAADWSQARIILPDAIVSCLQALPPDGRTVRLSLERLVDFQRGASRFHVVELDTSTGQSRPSAIPPDYYAHRRRYGCPIWSPDGQSMLFPRMFPDGRYRVMYSPQPDGGNAIPLMEGVPRIWLRSGKEFLFITSGQRIALGGLKGESTVLEGPGPAPLVVAGLDSDGGEFAAATIIYDRTNDPDQLELIDLRRMKRVASWSVPSIVRSVYFDKKRQRFQTVATRGENQILVELTEDRVLVDRGYIPGVWIANVLRVENGLLLVTYDLTKGRTLLVSPDGTERLIANQYINAETSYHGDVVYQEALGSRGNKPFRLVAIRSGARPQIIAEYKGGAPRISPDGRHIAYSLDFTGETFHCELGKDSEKYNCESVHTNPDNIANIGPIGPDNDSVPYFAALGGQAMGDKNLRVLSLRARRVRDLGRFATLCPPIWASRQGLWIANADASRWIEIDATSGLPLGREWPSDPGNPCADPPPEPSNPYRLRRPTSGLLDIRLVDDELLARSSH
jgi:serine/threonine protein kinase